MFVPTARSYCLSPALSVAPAGGGVSLLLFGEAHSCCGRRSSLAFLHSGLAFDVDLDVRAEYRAQIFTDVARYSCEVDLAGGKSGRRLGAESRKHRSFGRFLVMKGGSQSSFL
jgi:hypothetical protein